MSGARLSPRRLSSRAVALAVAGLSVVMPVGSEASHGCEGSVVYRYCGDHWRWDRIHGTGVRFLVNASGAPSSKIAGALPGLVNAAMKQWNDAWPGALAAAGFVEYPVPACRPLCSDGATSRGLDRDGKNVIAWGSPAACRAPDDAIAVACLWYEGDPADHRLDEVDILLNPSLLDKIWAIPDLVAEVPSEAMFWFWRPDEAYCRGPSLPGRPALPSRWQDVQSALTHELGHALGLDHLGNWPADLFALAAARQTMFDSGFPCLTHMRTLAEGDLVALQRVASRSLDD